MTEPNTKEKVEPITWLQCTLKKVDWDSINARRQGLNLKWVDIVLPATLEYLDKLEQEQAAKLAPAPVAEQLEPAKTEKAKKKRGSKKQVKEAPTPKATEQEPTAEELAAIEKEANK